MTTDDNAVRLNGDIFSELLDVIINDVVRVERTPEPWEDELLSLGRTLRLVCRLADARLRTYVSPVLELFSSKQAAQILLEGIPSRASLRFLTIGGSVKIVYLSSLLHALKNYPAAAVEPPLRGPRLLKLKGILFDYRDPSHSSISDLRFNRSTPAVYEAAIVCPSRPFDLADRFLGAVIDHGPVRRLALHGVYLWQIATAFLNMEVLVMRWLVTADAVHLLRYVLRNSALRRLIFVHSLLEREFVGQAAPLTAHEKWETAMTYQDVAITEVQPPVPTEEIAAWFAEQVRNGTIWNLEGTNWLNLHGV